MQCFITKYGCLLINFSKKILINYLFPVCIFKLHRQLNANNDDTENKWSGITEALLNTQHEIGPNKYEIRQGWMTSDILEIMDKRRKLKKKDNAKCTT